MIALNGCERLPRELICRLGQIIEHPSAPGAEPPTAALEAPPRYRSTIAGLLRDAQRLAAAERRRAVAYGGRLLTRLDAHYPTPLLDLALPPPVLYCLGEIPDRPATAIVGSRAADAYGREAATLFGRELAQAGLTVVSGLARGVDTAAHLGALASADGLTIGVLGCGLDIDYPPGSDRLRRQIATRGAVISEFPHGTAPLARNFPIRNRIIAALASGTLVIQGRARSGSLITARLALELGRDVYALPGRIFDDRAAGPNGLIRDGALPATSPRDILDSLPLALRDRLLAVAPPPSSATDTEANGPAGEAAHLLATMTPGELLPAEKLAAATRLGMRRALALLLELELDGHVRREPGPTWCRKA